VDAERGALVCIFGTNGAMDVLLPRTSGSKTTAHPDSSVGRTWIFLSLMPNLEQGCRFFFLQSWLADWLAFMGHFLRTFYIATF
jgi:hypothetical protein